MNTLKNNVRLTGFLGNTPEVKTFGNDKNLARVSLATNESYRNAQGDWVEETQWHQLVFWGKNAGYAEKHLSRGTEVAIDGRLVHRSYIDKEGITRYVTEISVNQVMQIGKKPLS